MKNCTRICFVFLFITVFGNNITENTSKAQNKQEKLKCYFEKIEYYHEKKQLDSSYPYLVEALKIAKQTDVLYDICYANYLMGFYYYLKGEPEQVSEYLSLVSTLSKNLSKEENQRRLMVRIKLALSAFYTSVSNLPLAIETLNQAIEFMDKNPDSDHQIMYMNNLAVIFISLNENEKAIDMFRKLIQRNISDDFKQTILMNFGSVFLKIEEPDSALFYLKAAENMGMESRKNYSIAENSRLIALAYEQKTFFLEAEEYNLKALLSSRVYNEKQIETKILIQTGSFYNKIHRQKEAEKYISQGIEAARNGDFLESECQGVLMLAQIYYDLKQYTLSYQKTREYLVLQDSLLKIKNYHRSNELIIQHEFLLKQTKIELKNAQEKEIERLKAKASHQQRIILFITLFLIFALSFGIVLFLLKKKSKDIKKQKEEKDNLKSKLEFKNKELTTKAMLQMQQVELIRSIEKELSELKKNMKEENQKILSPLIHKLRRTSKVDLWKDFEYQFNMVHERFYQNLLKDHPDLSPNEKKMCAFIYLNLSIKEIAILLNVDPNTVRVARIRLRKKLGITNEAVSLFVTLSKY